MRLMANRAVRMSEKFVTLNPYLILDILITEQLVTLGFYCMCVRMVHMCVSIVHMYVRMVHMCVRMVYVC